MALGTAITVAVLATLALGSRELALKLGGASSKWASAVWATCSLGGALVICLFGALLFGASLRPGPALLTLGNFHREPPRGLVG